jgi:hypothetical protein
VIPLALALPKQSPTLLVVELLVVLACGLGLAVTLLEIDPGPRMSHGRALLYVDRERDIAAAVGWTVRTWLIARLSVTVFMTLVGVSTGIPLMIGVCAYAGWVGFRWAFAGRAYARSLRMERAFLQQLRNLRDRMSLSHQSLDTALQEIGRNPGKELEYVLRPLARGGSVVANVVEAGIRSRSPVVEYSCSVLIWARTRSLESLIEAIDGILLEVGEAQLAVQEESLVTLTQQRAVTMAMVVLMAVMFTSVLRVQAFRDYYSTTGGQVGLMVVLGMFAFLVWILGILVKVRGWTRWDLRKLAYEQEHLGA